MKREDKVFKELFGHTDSILIIDVNGKVLYYEDFNDQINMIRYENAVGRSIFDLYPFFKREDFTVFKAIDSKSMIVNELQHFEVNGIPKKALNSAYPLINETGVIGCMVMSVELSSRGGQKKRKNFSAKYNFEDIITRNKTFLASFDVLRKLAAGDSSVLIYGETGTGKELIAHTIHNNSPRKRNPFIIQNCAAIPDNLIESTLFGSVKGSFTGAIDRPGLFEVADGGTLYFDEINSLSMDLQAKLLRVIENKSIRRVGDTVEREVDVRIIASTNENLSTMVEENRFRKDLFYRLNVASYAIMPLRQRLDDIPLVCEHYIKIFNARLNHFIAGIDDETMAFLISQPWEGNVRELKNVIEYACTIRSQGLITMSDLPNYMFSNTNLSPNSNADTDDALNGYDGPSSSNNNSAVNGNSVANGSSTVNGGQLSGGQLSGGQLSGESPTLSEFLKDVSNSNNSINSLRNPSNNPNYSGKAETGSGTSGESFGKNFESYISPGKTLEDQLSVLEKEIISRSLIANRYNVSKTAVELNISRQTLYGKLKKYQLL